MSSHEIHNAELRHDHEEEQKAKMMKDYARHLADEGGALERKAQWHSSSSSLPDHTEAVTARKHDLDKEQEEKLQAFESDLGERLKRADEIHSQAIHDIVSSKYLDCGDTA